MSEPKSTPLLDEVAGYYTARLAEHGETARGVDWNGPEGQTLRFAQLCKLFGPLDGESVADLGCGYAALYDHLARHHGRFRYLGVDVSQAMVESANRRLQGRADARCILASEPDETCDHVLASGIFNVRLSRSEAEWRNYVERTIADMDRHARLGFAFNCLTRYSDAERMRPDLHYADPCALFDLCKRRHSRNVALLHDYGLYEFTILVRKTP